MQELPNPMDPKQLFPGQQSLSLWQTHTLTTRELFSVKRGLGNIGAQLTGQAHSESSALPGREDLP